ncbi:hypothetical protein NAEGRDRAFT_73995 [Naegleria gruberi]|uniref:DED domain-containing protein n=1 Tax=Naegleria gruberi TaxID=5762 RepID=D2VY72_NAEGR|nr:uncharacterized protein NAEGRDRAFT_73995 [Naegleria gruberi]EFC38315.1 hypothetical protein NAEGRDRAFT_73995 [Naegleria gruberi]|eukprot:XP_002671059.1 hypothetical protein NAEGRDRAFT_73995 [Naegleria gruberi strain NEG-M]
MPPRTGKKRATKYVDYSSDESVDSVLSDVDDSVTSSEEKVNESPQPLRAPKKKLKKSTEERIKEVVGDDSQNVEEEGNDDNMVDEDGEQSVSVIGIFNTKRLLDARSKKVKRMDWEQGFFYLPKFDCYLPRHILHMILEYVPPFPYFLNIRCISQQWLDDFDTVICQNVKELDLIQRNDIDYELVKYNFPWYDSYCDIRTNNDCIRLLALLFPNVEKLIVPGFGTRVNVPNNMLTLFHKLQTMEIFYVGPLTVDTRRNYPLEMNITYRQDITNIQSITNKKYLTQFSSIVKAMNIDNSTLITVTNCLIPENVINLFKYLVKEQHFSLKRLNILLLPGPLYSKALIDFILEENVKHVERGYGTPLLASYSQILYIENDEIIDYMYEKQFFKNLLSPMDIDWNIISQVLSRTSSPKMFKILFEQSNFPLVCDEEINPLLLFIKRSKSTHQPEIIEFLCTLNPSIITLGDVKGIVNGDEMNLNILHSYLTGASNNEYTIDENIISSLIKAGCDVKFVCPTTGNNLIHIHPCSPSLIDAVPVEYFQMKNNKGYNPLERLIKRIEIERNIENNELLTTIDAFGKAYSKYGLSINELKFEKNQNLLHKLINLCSKARGIVSKLIQLGVDANAIDEDENLPLFYFLGHFNSDTDVTALIDSISEETLTKRYNNKSFLTNVIERLDSDEPNSHFYFGCDEKISTLDLLENLLVRGCNLNETLSELSDTYYEKGNLDRNRALLLMQLFNSIINPNLENLRTIFKYFDNFEDTLTKICIVKGTPISPLLYLLSLCSHHRHNSHSDIHEIFYSDNPLIPAKLLENIIDIPNKKTDALYYSVISSKSSEALDFSYLKGILGIKLDHSLTAFRYQPPNFTDIATIIASFRHEDEFYGNLNIVQLAVIMETTEILKQIHQIFSDESSLSILDNLYSEPFKDGTSILDELAKRGLFDAGNMYITTKQEWSIKHFRLAFESNHFNICYFIISDNSYTHDFTKEEILQILIGVIVERKHRFGNKDGQIEMAETIASLFSDLTLEERFKMFSTRFKIAINNEEKIKDTPNCCHNNGWLNILEETVFQAKLAWSKQNTPRKQNHKHHHFSLLDICYWKGLMYLLFYIVLEDTTGRKKKNILINSDLSKDILIPWITTKCDDTGKTLIHFACQKPNYYPDKDVIVKDLINYLSTVNRQDALNAQDNELKTAAFYALESRSCDFIFEVIDLSLKNNKGETVQDLMSDDNKIQYAKFFEKKETSKKETTTRRRKKQESFDDTSSDEEEKPRKTRSSTRNKK